MKTHLFYARLYPAIWTALCMILALGKGVWSVCPSKSGIIDLSKQNLTHIDKSVFAGCPSDADTLILSENRIARINKDSFVSGRVATFSVLKHLDLSQNVIEHIEFEAFHMLRDLESLKLNHNALTVLQNGLLDSKPYMKEVDFSYNNISYIGNKVFTEYLTGLRYVDLSNNALQGMEPWPYLPPFLLQFNLSYNRISTFTNTMNWTYSLTEPFHANVDLRHNKLKYWKLSYFRQYHDEPDVDYATDFVTYNLDVRENPWYCDCNLHYFSKSFKNSFYKHADQNLNEVQCHGPPELKGKTIFNDVGLNQFICNITDRCPNGCLCQDRPEEQVLKVNCTKAKLIEMPTILPDNRYNRTKLIMDENSINVLVNRSYTPHIVILSLKNNLLDTITDAAIKSMKNLQNANFQNNRLKEIPKSIQYHSYDNVDLKNNQFVCKCSMIWMREWIKLATENDKEDITCVYKEKETFKIRDVTESLLNCNYNVEIGLAVGFGVLLVMVVMIVVWAKRCPYETKVIVYKFFRCHPQDKYKVDEQDNTELDLYVSFDDRDIHIRQWVLRKLAKKLEEEKPRYMVFVPVRDLIAGVDKADSIIANIEKSRRIIILLSERYDDNEWCRFECHRAEILEHNDGRVIFIKYHPEADAMIETEPWKSRVKGRKVFSPGEKGSEQRWFWDKLRYELPVR